MRCDDAMTGRDHEEVTRRPRAIDQALDQGEVTGQLLELPAALCRLGARALLEAVVRFHTHLDEGELAVVSRVVIECVVEVASILLAVLLDQLLIVMVIPD